VKTHLSKFQIGKQGLTEGVIESLNNTLKNHKQVRISVPKSFCRDREELKKLARELTKKLLARCDHKLIGYTIILIKKSKK
jgi:RNA-binding protein YhbY